MSNDSNEHTVAFKYKQVQYRFMNLLENGNFIFTIDEEGLQLGLTVFVIIFQM